MTKAIAVAIVLAVTLGACAESALEDRRDGKCKPVRQPDGTVTVFCAY